MTEPCDTGFDFNDNGTIEKHEFLSMSYLLQLKKFRKTMEELVCEYFEIAETDEEPTAAAKEAPAEESTVEHSYYGRTAGVVLPLTDWLCR